MRVKLSEEYTGPNPDLYEIDKQLITELNAIGLHPDELASFRDEMGVLKVQMEISGDWRHDHLKCIHKMKELGWEVYSKDEEDSGEDYYYCYYVFINIASATEEVGKRALPGAIVESKKKTSKKNLKEGAVKELYTELEEELEKAYEDDPMDHYAGIDTTDARINLTIEAFAKDHNLSIETVEAMAREIQDRWDEEQFDNWEEWQADPEGYMNAHPEEFGADPLAESVKNVKGLRESEINDIMNKPFTELIDDFLEVLVGKNLLNSRTKQYVIEDLRKGAEPEDLDIDLLYDGVGADPNNPANDEMFKEIADMLEDAYMYADYWAGIDESDMIDDEDDADFYDGELDPLYGYGEDDEEHDMGEMYGVPHGATPEEALRHFESKKAPNKKSLKEKHFGVEQYFDCAHDGKQILAVAQFCDMCKENGHIAMLTINCTDGSAYHTTFKDAEDFRKFQNSKNSHAGITKVWAKECDPKDTLDEKKLKEEDGEEKYLTYKGHTCGWFKEDRVLFFNDDVKGSPNDWESYDRRALPDLKKRWKADIDKKLAKNECDLKESLRKGRRIREERLDEVSEDDLSKIVVAYKEDDADRKPLKNGQGITYSVPYNKSKSGKDNVKELKAVLRKNGISDESMQKLKYRVISA